MLSDHNVKLSGKEEKKTQHTHNWMHDYKQLQRYNMYTHTHTHAHALTYTQQHTHADAHTHTHTLIHSCCL